MTKKKNDYTGPTVSRVRLAPEKLFCASTYAVTNENYGDLNEDLWEE